MEWLDGCRGYEEPHIDFDTFFGTEDTLAGSDSDNGFSPSSFLSSSGLLDCSSSSCSTFNDSMNEVTPVSAGHARGLAASAPAAPPSSGYVVVAPTSSAYIPSPPMPILSCPVYPPVQVKKAKPSHPAVGKSKAKVVRKKRLLLKAMKDLPKNAYDELTVMPRKEMREILEMNTQNTLGNKSDLMVRITDCFLRGSLPRCPKCKTPSLVESNANTFFCTNQASGYLCDYECNDIARKAWKVRPGHFV